MEIIIKIVIVGLLISVVYNLFKAGVAMIKGDKQGRSMSHFIGRRLMFTAGLLLLLLLLIGLGVIEPNPNPYRRS